MDPTHSVKVNIQPKITVTVPLKKLHHVTRPMRSSRAHDATLNQTFGYKTCCLLDFFLLLLTGASLNKSVVEVRH